MVGAADQQPPAGKVPARAWYRTLSSAFTTSSGGPGEAGFLVQSGSALSKPRQKWSCLRGQVGAAPQMQPVFRGEPVSDKGRQFGRHVVVLDIEFEIVGGITKIRPQPATMFLELGSPYLRDEIHIICSIKRFVSIKE